MKIVKENLNEFIKTGDVKDGLNIGDVEGRKLQKELEMMEVKMREIQSYLIEVYDLKTEIFKEISRGDKTSNPKIYRESLVTIKITKPDTKLELYITIKYEDLSSSQYMSNASPYLLKYMIINPSELGIVPFKIPLKDWICFDDLDEDLEDAMERIIFRVGKKDGSIFDIIFGEK